MAEEIPGAEVSGKVQAQGLGLRVLDLENVEEGTATILRLSI
jgi:hypothetical protein